MSRDNHDAHSTTAVHETLARYGFTPSGKDLTPADDDTMIRFELALAELRQMDVPEHWRGVDGTTGGVPDGRCYGFSDSVAVTGEAIEQETILDVLGRHGFPSDGSTIIVTTPEEHARFDAAMEEARRVLTDPAQWLGGLVHDAVPQPARSFGRRPLPLR